HAAASAPRERGIRLGPVERGALAAERHERQGRELLRAVAGVVVEMALRLHQHAALVARQRAYREMVGERAARQEYRGLLAEQPRELGLQPLDRAAARILVAGRFRACDQVLQFRRPFAWRERYAVIGEVDG